MTGRREFQVRITDIYGEEECNCFATYEEALTVYNDRIDKGAEIACEIELIEVLAQHTIVETNSQDD